MVSMIESDDIVKSQRSQMQEENDNVSTCTKHFLKSQISRVVKWWWPRTERQWEMEEVKGHTFAAGKVF